MENENPEVQTQIDQFNSPPPPQNIIQKIGKTKIIIGLIILLIILVMPASFFMLSSKKTSENISPTSVPKNIYGTPIPTNPIVEDELLIKYKKGQTPEDQTVEQKAGIKKTFDQLGVISQEKLYNSQDPVLRTSYVLKFKKGIDVRKIIDTLKNIPEIENAETNDIHTAI